MFLKGLFDFVCVLFVVRCRCACLELVCFCLWLFHDCFGIVVVFVICLMCVVLVDYFDVSLFCVVCARIRLFVLDF